VWGELEHHDVLRVLHHPAYAGAYAFGRTRSTKTADGKVHIADVPRSEWFALVKQAHVGYITWEDYERNEAQLALNSQAYAPGRFSPPREGPALLQGLIICGKCGERMTVRYHQRGESALCPIISVHARAFNRESRLVNAFLALAWIERLERFWESA
jgi:hypothetical protein